ncbi:MAG: tRNA (guanosine(37)-N1)-methyltransferase TrmD [Thermodesulfobacteriota bacterium]|nr:tRNA (guanosine(37)-N1)-methyltransferase TrmD [Thermodesulfobacteriota bacterium]
MRFTVLTLFPDLVDAFFAHGIIGRACQKNLIAGACINIRDFSHNLHNKVDDRPYGGGAGMVMQAGPVVDALEFAKGHPPGMPLQTSHEGGASTMDQDSIHGLKTRVVMMTPQGQPFDQNKAIALAGEKQHIIFICGRYEGIDERVSREYVDEEISIGDYVMTGGELAAMVVIDAVSRLLPEVLGKGASARLDSFRDDRLEHAHYTRPPVFDGIKVPDILLSGDHGRVDLWRCEDSLKRTFIKRRDLFKQRPPDREEKKILRAWCRDLEALINV